MNKKFLIYFIAAFLVASVAVSCNSSSESTDNTYVPSSNVAITSFSLASNSKVLNNLDSVFFTIDLQRGLIYNADSLPLGTDVSRLLVNLEYASATSVEFNVKNGKVLAKDTTFAYSSSDSVDFTGDVKLTIVAADQVTKRTYDVKVNVHKMKPDSMSWDKLARRDLPSISGNVSEQRAVKYKDAVYCLMVDNGRYVLATGDNPATREWSKTVLTLPFNPDVRSLTATSNAVYMLDADNGTLYTSADFNSWTSCGMIWKSISGAYEDKLLGVEADGAILKHVAYPAISGFEPCAVEQDFPVYSTSEMCTFTTKWNTNPIGIIMSGIDASGNVVGDTWGFDGTTWGKISAQGVTPQSGMVLVPYFTFETSSNNWKVTEYSTWLAFGGRKADGSIDNTVYISRDNGVNWVRGDSLIQMPQYMEKVYGADALLFDAELSVQSRGTDEWTYLPSPKLPSWLVAESATKGDGSMLKASSPVVTWTCPYIYVFGGHYVDGRLANNIWRGVLNRLTFKPVL